MDIHLHKWYASIPCDTDRWNKRNKPQNMANKKKVGSIKLELLQKSREAMLSAVEIYNNPNIQFKSETFTVLAIIAWTYLYHAYYKSKNINYHYLKVSLLNLIKQKQKPMVKYLY